MKKYKDINRINLSLAHYEFEKRYYSEENLGLKFQNNGHFFNSACIEVINFISYIAFDLINLIDG